MKREIKTGIAVVLLLVCLFNFYPAFAIEEKPAQKMQFRGMPFGTTYEDALAKLAEEGYPFEVAKEDFKTLLIDKGYSISLSPPRALLYPNSYPISATSEISISDASVANLDDVIASYYFVCPDENNISALNSVLYKGTYQKELYNSSFSEYNRTDKNLRVLLESLYGRPATVKENFSFKSKQGEIVTWHLDDVDITLDIVIWWTNYDKLLGDTSVFITYEWKKMLPKVKYYEQEYEKQRKNEEKERIISQYGTNGL